MADNYKAELNLMVRTLLTAPTLVNHTGGVETAEALVMFADDILKAIEKRAETHQQAVTLEQRQSHSTQRGRGV